MRLLVQDLGRMEYAAAWRLQDNLAEKIACAEHPATLLLLEHPHTFTFGRRGQAANLLWSEEELQRRGVSVHWVDRGGDVTYHGPGQLVGYPLLPLPPLGKEGQADYVGYLRALEKALILALARLGLAAGQLTGHTGVWIQPQVFSRCPRCQPAMRGKPAKLAAIGVKVDARGVTRHGFALNVAPQMEYFDGIIPCGLAQYPVVSLADLWPEVPPLPRIKQVVAQALADTLGFEIDFLSKTA